MKKHHPPPPPTTPPKSPTSTTTPQQQHQQHRPRRCSASGGLAYLATRNPRNVATTTTPTETTPPTTTTRRASISSTTTPRTTPTTTTERRSSSNFLELPAPTFGIGRRTKKHHQPHNRQNPRLGSLPLATGEIRRRCCHSNPGTSDEDEDGDDDDDDEDEEEDALSSNNKARLYRLRTFKCVKKGGKGGGVVVSCCGDEWVVQEGSGGRSPRGGGDRRGSSGARSPTITTPTNHSPSPSSNHTPSAHSTNTTTSCCSSSYNSSMESLIFHDSTTPSFEGEEEMDQIEKFRIVLLGNSGVGKTTLLTQFLSSEWICTYDASLDDSPDERTLLVSLDDTASELLFIDHAHHEMSTENSMATYNPHAVILVYSINDRESFRVAEETIKYLWDITAESSSSLAIILVGNKCDLERARVVGVEEGKTLATDYRAKFIETCPNLQHNTDELLVGVLKQCRLRRGVVVAGFGFHGNRRNRNKNKIKKWSIQEMAWALLRGLTNSDESGFHGNRRNTRKRRLRSKSCVNLML